ncbi:hypothetical protein QTP70_003430 [Hemibagrus guttatus]|uniref:Uncharacterized protein n=1 Tax=Hemibagrus guttatus TaxID=175788 RepID=A0AAE0QJA7_9TELE|nr:hypothetical protein QTP70_003430 [Hemibagrus guttatus]
MVMISDISSPSPTEIPEDEARYWSNKLESINAMGMHDEFLLQDDGVRHPLPLATSQCSLDDLDSAMDDRDSDYRSETSNSLPPRYHTTAQPNSSVHQYPVGPRFQQHPDSCTDSVHSFELDYRDNHPSRTLNEKGRVRIIPVDSGMGVEDWEFKYKMWHKGSLDDFLDKEECDLDAEVTHFTRCSQDSTISQQPLKTKVKTTLNPAYPEGYDTIDRRRRKKVRDPFGLVNTRTEFVGEDLFNPDLALLRQKRGELVLRQVAEMEEEEEKMMPCLRPYKNGLFYKTRMQAKNKLENTLHDYMALQDEEETRHRLSIDPNSEGSDEIQGSEEEMEEFCSEISQHHKRYKKDSSFCGYTDNLQGYCDKKITKGKTGEWTPEVLLSPVEEPSDEYVDPIDELQCLVETVSEYLAEKEEEINDTAGPKTAADIEDYAFFEDTEWYQQWLLLLEQGMWWPADDGDCGYFVYTDYEYIYALLTDGSGHFQDDGSALSVSASRVRWIKAFNKVRLQLQELKFKTSVFYLLRVDAVKNGNTKHYYGWNMITSN